MTNLRIEHIGNNVQVCTSKGHTFGTDSFLLAHFAAPRRQETACDLCTGCGIVPLLWMREIAPRTAYAVDLQPQAIEQLKRSAELSGLQQRLHPVLGDLREPIPGIAPGKMDLVTANPPYYAPHTGFLSTAEEGRLARHETACSIRDVCSCAARLLRYGGRFCLCHVPSRLTDALEAMRQCGIEPKRLRFVQKKPDTAPWLFLLEGKRGAKPSLKVEAPLALYRDAGGPTAEMAEITRRNGRV